MVCSLLQCDLQLTCRAEKGLTSFIGLNAEKFLEAVNIARFMADVKADQPEGAQQHNHDQSDDHCYEDLKMSQSSQMLLIAVVVVGCRCCCSALAADGTIHSCSGFL